MTTTTTFIVEIDFLQAALLSASNEETRYYLKGVHLLRRGAHLRIAATDGRRMFCAMQTLDEPGPDFEVILPRDGLKRALTGVTRKTSFLPLDLEIDGDTVKRATLNDVVMTAVDGSFPSIDRVIPRNPSGDVAQFNPAYMADLGKQAKILGGSPNNLHITQNGPDPALITFGGTRSAFAVLMPLRPQVEALGSYEVADILGENIRPATDEKAA